MGQMSATEVGVTRPVVPQGEHAEGSRPLAIGDSVVVKDLDVSGTVERMLGDNKVEVQLHSDTPSTLTVPVSGLELPEGVSAGEPSEAPGPSGAGHGVPVKEFDLEALQRDVTPKVKVPQPGKWKADVSDARLETLGEELVSLSESIVDQENVPGDAADRLRRMASELAKPIAKARAELGALQKSMKEQKETFSWWERNINDPADYDAKQALEKSMESWIEDAEALMGGASIALRVQEGQEERTTPEAWTSERAQLESKARSVSRTPDWSGAIADLVAFQGRLSSELQDVRADASSRSSDLDAYDERTGFFQETKWLDVLTLGESVEGKLYRMGVAQRDEATDLGENLSEVYSRGEQVVHDRIDQLLQYEDPQGFGELKRAYNVVKPAYDQLRRVEGLANTVLRRLSSVDSAVSYANIIALQKPSQTKTVYQDGKAKVVSNPAYSTWQFQMRAAEASVISAKNSASSAVHSLNSALPALREQMDRNEVRSYFSSVHDSLTTWNNWVLGFGLTVGGWARFATWGYEDSQVAGLRNRIYDLQRDLDPMDAIITPRYRELLGDIEGRIADRRAELSGPA